MASVLLNMNCNDKGECLASYICHCYAIREGSLCLSRTVRVFSTVVRLEIHTFEYKSSLYCWNNVGQHSCAWVDLWSSDVLFMSEQFERVMTCSSLFSHQQQHHTVYPALMVSAKDSLCVCVCVWVFEVKLRPQQSLDLNASQCYLVCVCVCVLHSASFSHRCQSNVCLLGE